MSDDTDDEMPTMICPRCNAVLTDYDGFGVLAHTRPAYADGCGYCTHPSRDDGVCGYCGDRGTMPVGGRHGDDEGATAMSERVVHCWADGPRREEDWVGSTCMLLDGHAGPHEWTPDDEIGVTFPDRGAEELE